MRFYSLYDEKRDAYVRGEGNYEDEEEALERRDAVRAARGHDQIEVYVSADYIPGLVLN